MTENHREQQQRERDIKSGRTKVARTERTRTIETAPTGQTIFPSNSR